MSECVCVYSFTQAIEKKSKVDSEEEEAEQSKAEQRSEEKGNTCLSVHPIKYIHKCARRGDPPPLKLFLA